MKNAQDKIKGALRRLMDEHGVDMATVSRAIGKNHAYIQQYMTRGIPAELSYKTAMALARYFSTGIDTFGITGVEGIRASNDTKKQRHPVETIRRMMGLSVVQFAGALGSTSKQIEAIEAGVAPLTEALLLKICQTFKVDPEDLRDFVPQFSEDERQLVYRVRQMTPEQRKSFQQMMRKFDKERA